MFGIGSLSSYESYDQVGEGTYGYVYRAKDKRTGDQVALKRLIFHKESAGFPLCAVREIKFLKSLSHKNIVTLKEIVTSKGCEHLDSNVSKKSLKTDAEPGAAIAAGIDENKDKENKKEDTSIEPNKVVQLCGNMYLVFEYIDHDLGGLVDSKYKFSQRSIKCIAKQLFEALDYLNEKKVIHRDIKTSNILLSNRHQLKLADFGLARSSLSSDGREGKIDLTNNVVTMWYKAPELLLGATRYTNAIDIWSAGCVLAELELGRPIFPGKTELEQFELTCKILGTPNEDNWVNLTSLANYDSFIKNNSNQWTKYPNIFRTAYDKKINDQALTLLERIFVLDPDRRPSPKIILTHNYFFAHPLPPTNPSDLDPLQLTPGSSLHEYETKLKRKMQANATAIAAASAAASVAEVTTTVTAAAVGSSVPVPPPSIYCLPSTTQLLTTTTAHVNSTNGMPFYAGQQQPIPLPMGFSGGNLSGNSMIPPPFNPASVGFMPPPPTFPGGKMYAYGEANVNAPMPVPPPFRAAEQKQPQPPFPMPNNLQQPQLPRPQWGYPHQQPQFHQPNMQPLPFQSFPLPPPASSITPADAMYNQHALGGGGADSYNSSSGNRNSSNYGIGVKGLCDYFTRNGICLKGDDCVFLHTADPESATSNRFSNNGSSGSSSSSSSSSSGGYRAGSVGICFAFQKGECYHGNECRYSHQNGGGRGGGGGYVNSSNSNYGYNRQGGYGSSGGGGMKRDRD